MQASNLVLSEKYMAGFMDSDGSIGVRARVGARPDLVVEISQRSLYSEIPQAFVDEFGGYIRERIISGGAYTVASMRGKVARKCVERLKGHLVCKRSFAASALKLVDDADILRTEDDLRCVRNEVKLLRALPETAKRNYPPRKWLAGYFDGDGCLSVKVCKKTGYAYPFAAVLAAPQYRAGLVLLSQTFGGSACQKGDNWVWQLQLSQPSKAIEFLSYFAKELIVKKPQAYFLLGCAGHGNFRDGSAIRDTIKALNSQQHRLSDPAGTAASLVSTIDFDIEKRRVGRPSKRQSNIGITQASLSL